MSEKSKPALRSPSSYLTGLERTNDYLGFIAQSGDRATSLGRAASALSRRMAAESAPSLERQQDTFAVQLIGMLPTFLKAQLALRKIEQQHERGHGASAESPRRYVKDVIPFNHTLRDMIDMFPNLKVNDVTRFTKSAALDMFGPQEAIYAEQLTKEVLVGMQHEIGLEQILWQLEDVEDVIKATPEQEHYGIDMIAVYKGEELALDAKASSRGAERASTKWYDHLDRGNGQQWGYPIWTRINYEDFGGGFRISNDRAKQLAPYIKSDLDQLDRQLSVAL